MALPERVPTDLDSETVGGVHPMSIAGRTLLIPLPRPLSAQSVLPVGTRCAALAPLTARPAEVAPVVAAPGDGVIEGVADVDLLGGGRVAAVVFRVDEPLASTVDKLAGPAASPASRAELLDLLHLRGVHIDRPTCPDLCGQIADERVRQVVCCLLDDEGLGVPSSVEADGLCDTVARVARALSARGAILIDKDWTNAELTRWRRAAKRARLSVLARHGRYPRALASITTRWLTGRLPDIGQRPSRLGVCIMDAAAAGAVGDALAGVAMQRVDLRVLDHRQKQTHRISAPVGATVGMVLSWLGLPASTDGMRAGAFLRDRPARLSDVIGPGELALHLLSPAPQAATAACLRCGWCIDACPTGVDVPAVFELLQACRPLGAMAEHAEACVDCGLCTAVCPSRLPLAACIVARGREAQR